MATCGNSQLTTKLFCLRTRTVEDDGIRHQSWSDCVAANAKKKKKKKKSWRLRYFFLFLHDDRELQFQYDTENSNYKKQRTTDIITERSGADKRTGGLPQ